MVLSGLNGTVNLSLSDKQDGLAEKDSSSFAETDCVFIDRPCDQWVKW